MNLPIDRIMQAENALSKLICENNFIGWVYAIDYEYACILTNDLWKAKCQGVPHNCFLTATTLDVNNLSSSSESDKEVVLLRVIDTANLPQDNDMIITRIDSFQNRTSPTADASFDDITKNMLQFSGIKCRILGTFYTRNNKLWLGSDIENFSSSTSLKVYKPEKEALKKIVNYVDPIRKQKAVEDAQQMGFESSLTPFNIGTIRYTSTDHLHRSNEEYHVPVQVQPSDFLARRTAVLGMTRTGKSNMIKQLVSVVKKIADHDNVKIGQIIYDINGEYANANQQDQGAISEIFKNDSIRYRMVDTPGFEMLQNNFYLQINEGFNVVRELMRENANSSAADIKTFMNTSFDEPDKQNRSLHYRWQVRVGIYQCLLHRANFKSPDKFKVKFIANSKVRDIINNTVDKSFTDQHISLTLDEACEAFEAIRDANRSKAIKSSSGKKWLDEDSVSMLNMLVNKNSNDAYINGYKLLTSAARYHSPKRSSDINNEIYSHLLDGKIVILDLSVGDATMRERISKSIAKTVFQNSMNKFLDGHIPPNIVFYIEEAHNLIGKGMDLTETWPRLAKEGAKYRISLVYATQEVSSVHPNILANTENWFITHLNNKREIKELCQFYDFEDFAKSLLRAQDVGFARVKTLSSPYVIPVQIDKFDPEILNRNLW